MNIVVKSEADSRIFVYPLMKCLYNYGTIAVFTSNKYFGRLIEGDVMGGFKDIRIVVVEDGDIMGAMAADEYYDGKYDFLILDNVGYVDYDVLFAVVTNHISDNYVQELLYIVDEDTTHIIKFGSAAPAPKKEKPAKKPKKKKGSEESEEVTEEVEEPEESDGDSSFNKWNSNKTDEEILADKLGAKESKWCKFPTFEDIERMEARHYMIVPDDSIIKEVYRIIGSYLNVDERMFTKGVRVKDESSCYISGTDVR